MQLKIYQLKKENQRLYGFMDYNWAIKNNFKLDRYECVWEENIDSDTSLEEIFERFNVDRPDEFKGHSLSVSDIIDLEGNKYYVDDFGFKKVEE